MQAGRALRDALAAAIRDARARVGWSRAELAARAGVSREMVHRLEACTVNVTVDTAGRVLDALGVAVEPLFRGPFVASPRQGDRVHAQCVAYVQRRLEAAGWLVRREVELARGRSHGWIDVLAFDPVSRTLLVIEVKTEIHDVGRIERTLGWYGREAWAAARRIGWRPAAARTALLLLATEANEERLRANRELFAQAFPARGMAVLDTGPSGLAMIDPRSHRREWLGRAMVDGRRSRPPYRDYAGFVAAAAASARSRHR